MARSFAVAPVARCENSITAGLSESISAVGARAAGPGAEYIESLQVFAADYTAWPLALADRTQDAPARSAWDGSAGIIVARSQPRSRRLKDALLRNRRRRAGGGPQRVRSPYGSADRRRHRRAQLLCRSLCLPAWRLRPHRARDRSERAGHLRHTWLSEKRHADRGERPYRSRFGAAQLRDPARRDGRHERGRD